MLRLTHEREKRGWSKAKLARRADLDQGIQCKIENRRVNPYPVELRRVARALGWREDPARLLDEMPTGSTEAPGQRSGPEAA